MPDTPFKAMGREKRESYSDWDDFARRVAKEEFCEKCLGWVREGDWPFCKGSPDDHKR